MLYKICDTCAKSPRRCIGHIMVQFNEHRMVSTGLTIFMHIVRMRMKRDSEQRG